jgi:hypothetical protein
MAFRGTHTDSLTVSLTPPKGCTGQLSPMEKTISSAPGIEQPSHGVYL